MFPFVLCSHNTEYVYSNMYTWTINVILVKCCLWAPDNDLYKPKHVGATVKAVPLEAWSGPQGSRKLRFPDFLTTAQDGGKVVGLVHRPHLPPGNTPGTHFC
jgi:hypothetical protein